ncbi:hypothetical protein [Pseudomonas aeruginosa]|uniref:hypothetical protein n=1 Tax=Pseudomonas aeruginosa TaxID=287 RepID=UPI001044D690|nr:hypothetical protein [Pseudomonas aeruginosa]
MKTKTITMIRTVTFKRVFELPAGVEITEEQLDKVQSALNIQYPAHLMREVAEQCEFIVEEGASLMTAVRLQVEGERVFLLEGEGKIELELSEA